MKTTMITLATIFTLLTNILIAGNDYINTTPAPATTVSVEYFTPAFPAVATFEDGTIAPDFSGLYPVVPAEASFDENVTSEFSLDALAPVIPSEADFE